MDILLLLLKFWVTWSVSLNIDAPCYDAHESQTDLHLAIHFLNVCFVI